MESLLQIGLIAAETAIAPLFECLRSGAEDETQDTALLNQIGWILCRPEDPEALHHLQQADTVIVGAFIRSEQDMAAIANTVQTLQRVGRKILAVVLWGHQSKVLALRFNWPGVLLPDGNDYDQPPRSALRACVCEAVRQKQISRNGQGLTVPAKAIMPDGNLPTARRHRRGADGRMIRDLSHLRQPGSFRSAGGAVSATPALEREIIAAQSGSGQAEAAEAGEQSARMAELDALVKAADERARFAEAKAEDFFQRLADEKRRANVLTDELKTLRESRVQAGATASPEAVAEYWKDHVSRLERVRELLTDERDKAFREREEARTQVSELQEELEKVQREFQAASDEFVRQIHDLESLRDNLLTERDQAQAAPDARQSGQITQSADQASLPEASDISWQQHLHELESLNEEAAYDRERLQAELDHEHTLYSELEQESQMLAGENSRLTDALQSMTTRLMELETALKGSSATTLSGEALLAVRTVPGALTPSVVEEGNDPEYMLAEDATLIRRIETDANQTRPGAAGERWGSVKQTDGADSRFIMNPRRLLYLAREAHKSMKIVAGVVERLLIREREEASPEQRRIMLDVIQRMVHEVLHSFTSVMDYAQLENATARVVTLTPVNLADLAQELTAMIEPLLAEGKVSLSVSMPPDLPAVQTDGEKLRRILLHLLVNAAKFVSAGSIRLTIHPIGEKLIMAVSDTGCGITPADHERIFNPFEKLQRRKPGAGLGLTVVQKLAGLIGGRITVESEPDRETTFTLILPYEAITETVCMPEAVSDDPVVSAESDPEKSADSSVTVTVSDHAVATNTFPDFTEVPAAELSSDSIQIQPEEAEV